MKLHSPIEEKKARIEIIPLIDIMFFLLACFMAISLSMIQMRGMRIALPTASSGQAEHKTDFVGITVDPAGGIYFDHDKTPLADKAELTTRIKPLFEANNELRIYIRADQEARHGDVVTVLDLVRAAGVQKVAFEIKAQSVTPPGAAPTAPAAPVPPVAPKTP